MKNNKSIPKAQAYNDLMKEMNIDETYTKFHKKAKFDNIKSNIPPREDYNMQADLLMLPTTQNGYKYLLVIVDLWTDEIDAEPLKTKQPMEVLEAAKTIFKRQYLNKPYATLRTDAGTEFKGVFHKWLFDNSILHSISLPHRHKQMANVESVNKLLGRFLNNYMNTKEQETGKAYREWTDILTPLIKNLNKIRRRKPLNPYTYNYPISKDDAKYKVGDVVIRKLDAPKNALNNQESGKFRMGDYRFDFKEPRKINKILYYPNNIRYVLDGFENVSYTEDELMTPKNDKESKFSVRKIIDHKKIKNNKYYKVWWKGYNKKQATWESEKSLIEDGLKKEIEDYKNSLKD